jgi:glycosyltransferase involved in cell wall biosynthesis
MKILFVHEVSWFSKVVYEIHDFPELLSLSGNDVSFLEFEEHKPGARWKSVESIESRSHSGSTVSVISPPHVFSGLIRRLAATIIQPLTFIKLLKRIQPDVVVTYSIPTSGWQVVSICRRREIPVMVRAIDVSHKLRKSRFEAAIKKAERFVYSNADHVCANNEALRQYCISLGASPDRSSVIYPGIDTARFYPAQPRQDLQDELGIKPTDNVLLFMGTIFRFSGLTEILADLGPALHKNPTLKFLILGEGEDFIPLQRLVESLGLQHQVIMPGRIEYDILADYLRLGHVALLPFRPELVTHCALPGKVLQYLACGLPTIATPLNGLQSMIAPDKGVLYANNLKEMAIIAEQLSSDSQHRNLLSTQGIELMNSHCNWQVQMRLFEELLGRLTHA